VAFRCSKNHKVPCHITARILQKTAKNYPANVAIAYDEKETTYAQLDLLSNQFAHALAKLGVAKGDRVALFLPNVEGTAASAKEIASFVNSKVASYKAIREVEFRKELPISSAGKVLRRPLQEEEKGKPFGAEIRKLGNF
jgi:acyl-CoA synthetase (AMP-forming)/AMP-acid ligase II